MISVIIPVYNAERYLNECLESIVKQSFYDKEVILVNDGSTDTSRDICDLYASKYPFIRVIHRNNAGPSVARNLGIEQSRGEWIIFMDADDAWSDRRCLEKLHSYASSYNLDILRFEYQSTDEQLNPITNHSHNKSGLESRVIDNYTMVKEAIAGEWFTVLFLIKRETISNLRFNEGKGFLEDCDFYCKIFASQPLRCGYLNAPMYLYRKIPQSISKTIRIDKLAAGFTLCDVFHQASMRIKDEKLRQLYCWYSVMMYYWTLQTLADQPYYKEKDYIIYKLHLKSLHKRIKVWLISAKINFIYRIFIYPSPCKGVVLLHLKDKIRALFP